MHMSTSHRTLSGALRNVTPVLVFTTALAVTLAGCSGEAPSSATASTKSNKDIVIAFANATPDGDTYNGLEKSLEHALDGTGASLLKYNNNGDSATTFKNISAMIAEKPDVIIEVNPVADASERIGQQLKDSGIPCIAVNVPIPGCHFFNQDSAPMGEQLATEVAAEMKARNWSGEDTDVVLVGSAAYGGLNDVLGEFYAPLSKIVPGMKPVAKQDITTASDQFGTNGYLLNTDYSIDAAFRSFATELQRIPEGRKIIVDCLGDELCLGARKALENAGRLDDAMIMAWGATPDAMVDLAKREGWDFESANFFSSWDNSSHRWHWL